MPQNVGHKMRCIARKLNILYFHGKNLSKFALTMKSNDASDKNFLSEDKNVGITS